METALHYLSSPDQCGYLPDRNWRFEYIYVLSMSSEEYSQRLETGWRRFGRTLFRPRCQGCAACQSLRIPVQEFRPDRSQRRNAALNRDALDLRIAEPVLTKEKLALFDRFHAFQSEHRDWPEHDTDDASGYFEHFLENPILTEEWSYYLGQALVGVGFVDVLPRALSAIYFYHDPDMRRHGLGIWNILRLIEECRRRRLLYLYLGYFVPGCPSMHYKSHFYPHERRLGDGAWKRIENSSHRP